MTNSSGSVRLRLTRVFLALGISALAAASMLACSAADEDKSDTSDEAFTAETSRVAIGVANTLSVDTLSHGVGLGAPVAAKVVERRPFTGIPGLRNVVGNSGLDALLAYGNAHPAAVPPTGNVASGAARVVSLGCQELFRDDLGNRGETAALSLAWIPPAEMEFIANRESLQWYANMPLNATVTDGGIVAESTFEARGATHHARLDLARADRKGSFMLDDASFRIECSSIVTTAWESSIH